MAVLHDPLRDGPRNDHIQDLMNRYQQQCKEEGLAQHPRVVAALANLDAKGIDLNLQKIAHVVEVNARAVAANFVERPEYRPLMQHWVNRVGNENKEKMRQGLVDIGAKQYIDGIRYGV